MNDIPPDRVGAANGQGHASSGRDLLSVVVKTLNDRKGSLRDIARAAGMSYDTVRRIKNQENDPAYGKVKRLATTLGIDWPAASG